MALRRTRFSGLSLSLPLETVLGLLRNDPSLGMLPSPEKSSHLRETSAHLIQGIKGM